MSLNEDVLDNSTNTNGISSQAIQHLGKASGWVKAVAILGFIGGGFMALGAIGMFITIPLMGFLYLVIAGAYIYLSILLLNQANSIQGANPNMEKFALSYFTFWKTAVIIMIVMFGLSLIAGIAIGAAGFSTAF